MTFPSTYSGSQHLLPFFHVYRGFTAGPAFDRLSDRMAWQYVFFNIVELHKSQILSAEEELLKEILFA